MPKILNNAQFITMSAPATPTTGYGSVFASGSSLYFINSSGVISNLVGSSGGGYSIIREYTGSATWTKPAGIYEIMVVCVGAGGGGGGGRCGALASNRAGGGGGGGGALAMARISTASLTGTTYSITVSNLGGTAGTGAGTTAGNGGNGFPGTDTVFYTGSTNLVLARAGVGGVGGTTGATQAGGGAGGSSITSIPSRLPFSLSGIIGGNGNQGGGAVGSNAALNAFDQVTVSSVTYMSGISAGGAGGGINTSNGTTTGGSGSAIYNYGNLIQSGSPGAAGSGAAGSPGADNIVKNLLLFSGSVETVNGVGTGGSGGGSPGGAGGNGGNRGAGGGGGAGTTSGSAVPLGGNGGTGGGGLCIIVEYY